MFAFRTTTECVADAFLAKRTIVYFEALAFFSVPKKVWFMSHFCCLLTKEEDAYLGGDTMPKIIYVSYVLYACIPIWIPVLHREHHKKWAALNEWFTKHDALARLGIKWDALAKRGDTNPNMHAYIFGWLGWVGQELKSFPCSPCGQLQKPLLSKYLTTHIWKCPLERKTWRFLARREWYLNHTPWITKSSTPLLTYCHSD